MTKAKREMQKRLSLADVAVEVLDARAPLATTNPDLDEMFKQKPRVVVLNKEDLAHPATTARWLSHLRENGMIAVAFNAVKSGKHKALHEALAKAAEPAVARWAKRGAVRPVRAIVIGIPNVGKSSVINALSGERRTKVGASPGVTRGQQWVRIANGIELLDTPGVLWPKFDDERTARHLAYLNAIRDEVLEAVPLAHGLIDDIKAESPGALTARYKLEGEQADAQALLMDIARARGCILRGGTLDVDRAAAIVLDEFRRGVLGRITLEAPRGGPMP